ncbi:hypothetical protein [Limnobacter litoralis]|uniref:hypothetical protein n=1 Tax=Limnobacter litoralis TaxID=481366 RepID=UPI0024E0A408|nr:hypothetical protein [Limnobacter litoralis]
MSLLERGGIHLRDADSLIDPDWHFHKIHFQNHRQTGEARDREKAAASHQEEGRAHPFLITSMMRKTFKDLDQTFESDSHLENAKRQIRQQQEAQKISRHFSEQGRKILTEMEKDIEHHFFDPSTLQSYKLKEGIRPNASGWFMAPIL